VNHRRFIAAAVLFMAAVLQLTSTGRASDEGVPMTQGAPHICMQFYPSEAQRHGWQGVTDLSFRVRADGSVTDPVVTHTSGYDILDQASLNCVSRWRYTPVLEEGVPVEVEWQAHVTWMLH
jgi:TonB family protein